MIARLSAHEYACRLVLLALLLIMMGAGEPESNHAQQHQGVSAGHTGPRDPADENDNAGVLLIPDVDGDGIADLAIASPNATINAETFGRVDVLRTSDGVVLRSLTGLAHDQFGFGLDIRIKNDEGDTSALFDLIVHASFQDDVGNVYIREYSFPNANAEEMQWQTNTEAGLPVYLAGDMNFDGVVDAADLAALLARFGLATTGVVAGDLDGSGFIGSGDLAALLGNFGMQAAPTPFPSHQGHDLQHDDIPNCAPWICTGENGGGGDGGGGGGDGPPPGIPSPAPGPGPGGPPQPDPRPTPPGPGPPSGDCDCSCEGVQLTGVDYVGSGKFIALQVQGGLDACPVDPGSVLIEVTSGTDLLKEDMRTAKDDAQGSVTFKLTMTYCDGEITCSDTHTVEIRRYKPIKLRYAAFIPCPGVKNPAPIGNRFFGGDNRTFSATSTSYRSVHQPVTQSPHAYEIDVDPVVINNALPPFGTTTGYNPPAAGSVAGWCDTVITGAPTASATLAQSCTLFLDDSLLGNHCQTAKRTTASQLWVRFMLNGANPLVPGSCPIDANLNFLITWFVDPDTGTQSALVQHSGSHDPFPAHEIYVENLPVLLYDPVFIFAGAGSISDFVLTLCTTQISVPITSNTFNLGF